MIKQITVAECDICGRTEKARLETFRNETSYKLPDGWIMSEIDIKFEKLETGIIFEANRQFCICPQCWGKLTRHE